MKCRSEGGGVQVHLPEFHWIPAPVVQSQAGARITSIDYLFTALPLQSHDLCEALALCPSWLIPLPPAVIFSISIFFSCGAIHTFRDSKFDFIKVSILVFPYKLVLSVNLRLTPSSMQVIPYTTSCYKSAMSRHSPRTRIPRLLRDLALRSKS